MILSKLIKRIKPIKPIKRVFLKLQTLPALRPVLRLVLRSFNEEGSFNEGGSLEGARPPQ
jgi:hypothetical protein